MVKPMAIRKKWVFAGLLFAVGLCIFAYYDCSAEKERRAALISEVWIGNNGYPQMDFLPDGSVEIDRANSEMVGRVRIEKSPSSTINGYYRAHQKCKRIFVFDDMNNRLGTYAFDGEVLLSEGGYTYFSANYNE